jgi:anti-anti-sigma regulatory factor
MTMLTSPLRVIPGRAPDGVPTVILRGRADDSNFQALAEALYAQMPAGVTKLLVDAGALASVTDLAARSMAQAARVLRSRGGQLTLLGARAEVLAVLRETGATADMFIQT